MCRLSFCLTISLLTFAALAQPRLTDLKQAKMHIVQPVPIEWGGKALPFNKVVVIDSRSDTSKLGYIMDVRNYRKLHTKGSLAETIEKDINSTHKKSNDTNTTGTLYIFIKHFWLQQSSGMELSKRKLSHGFINTDTLFATCKATLECYVQQDSLYYPLLRMDSNLVIRGILRKKANQLVTLPFQVALTKLAGMDLSKKRKPMTWQQVLAYSSHKSNSIPLQADTLARGVYITFQDFLHKRVTYKTFNVQWGAVTDELYITEGSKKELLESFWGFCDGEKQYMKLGFSFFELSKENNTYELLGAKGLIYSASGGDYNAGSLSPAELLTAGVILVSKKSSVNTTLVKPLQLNMETGESY